MTFEEIFAELNDASEGEKTKSLISLSYKLHKLDTNVIVPKSSLSAENAKVLLYPTENVIQVMLTFPTATDANLRLFWGTINAYFSAAESLTEESASIPVLTLNIIPKAFGGEYFAALTVPLYRNLVTAKVGNVPNAISLIFDVNSLHIYHTDEINDAMVESEVERELAEEERMETLINMREQEREELAAKRNEQTQKNRRNPYLFS